MMNQKETNLLLWLVILSIKGQQSYYSDWLHYVFKGTAAWDFWSWVFHQTTPSGLVRGYLEPFSILATFHGVIQVLKGLPGIQDTGELRIPGRRGVENPRCPGHQGFFFYTIFILQANLPSSGTPWICQFSMSGIHKSQVCGTPGSQESLVSRTPEVANPQCPVFWLLTVFFKLQAIALAYKAIIYQKSMCVFYLLHKYFWFMCLKFS